MALAHQVSLIDIGGTTFQRLRTAVDALAGAILADVRGTNSRGSREEAPITKVELRTLRNTLRERLGTWPSNVAIPTVTSNMLPEAELNAVVAEVNKIGELFIGVGAGPFVVLLKARSRDEFLAYAKNRPVHEIMIHWDRESPLDWWIEPASQSRAYRLDFKIPDELAEVIFRDRTDPHEMALEVKESYFAELTVYHRGDDRDYLFRLKFDASKVKAELANRKRHRRVPLDDEQDDVDDSRQS